MCGWSVYGRVWTWGVQSPKTATDAVSGHPTGMHSCFQVILLVYWFSLLCRKNQVTGESLSRSPIFMSPWISVFYVMNMASNSGKLNNNIPNTTIRKDETKTPASNKQALPTFGFKCFPSTFAYFVAWLFAWDRENLPVAVVLLVLATVTLYACLGISFYSLSSNKNIMLDQGLSLEIRLVIGMLFHTL